MPTITECLCGQEAAIHVLTKVCQICGYTKKGISRMNIFSRILSVIQLLLFFRKRKPKNQKSR